MVDDSTLEMALGALAPRTEWEFFDVLLVDAEENSPAEVLIQDHHQHTEDPALWENLRQAPFYVRWVSNDEGDRCRLIVVDKREIIRAYTALKPAR